MEDQVKRKWRKKVALITILVVSLASATSILYMMDQGQEDAETMVNCQKIVDKLAGELIDERKAYKNCLEFGPEFVKYQQAP